MALLLSGRTRNASAPSGYIGLGQTQQQLGNTPTTSTGYTVVTVNSVTSYRSSIGEVNFTYTNTASIFGTQIVNGSNVLRANGTGSNFILGPTFIPELQANTAFKGPVKAATTANIVLVGGAPITVSGYNLIREDRVLVRAQANPAENGIYFVSFLGSGANGTWIRTTDADTAEDMSGALVAVSSGTAFVGRYFFTDFTSKDVLNVDPINWYQIIGDALTNQQITNKTIDATPIGTVTPDVGYFTNIQSGPSVQESIIVSSTATSTGSGNGALVVTGGVGIGDKLYVEGESNFNTTTNFYGQAFVVDATSATSTFTGAMQIAGGLGANGAVYARAVYVDGVPLDNPYWNGGQITDPFYVANIEGAFNTYTGALKVLGGVGIGGDVYIGKSLTLESPNPVDTVFFRMRNTATNGQSYTLSVGGNNAAGQAGTSVREGSLTLYDDRNSTFRLILVKSTGNLVVGGQSDNGVDKLQVNGSIQFGDAQLFTRTTSINNTATTVVDSWPALTYRTTKSLVQITDGSGPTAKFHVVEIVILRDNSNNVYKSEYGIITTGGQKGTFDVDCNVGGNGLVRLLFRAESPSAKTIKVQRTSLAV